jgi:hypothetical protein
MTCAKQSEKQKKPRHIHAASLFYFVCGSFFPTAMSDGHDDAPDAPAAPAGAGGPPLMRIEIGRINKGFLMHFDDTYMHDCSLQQSSAVGHIWFGMHDPKISVGYPWTEVKPSELKAALGSPEELSLGSRMHLNRAQVAVLLPMLKQFADTGTLPEPK